MARTLRSPLLLVVALSGLGNRAIAMPAGPHAGDDPPIHMRCARVTPGMAVSEALALMGRTPDSSLSGHVEAGADGTPPGTQTVDEWYSRDARGQHLTSRVRYTGDRVESVECDKSLESRALPPPLPSGT